ncbi:MAG: dihydropteroate synthase [Vicinamibacterales bacterium]|jgi:dihydropteroate synthase|nr:dihydropteroate synthase [Vicinamibacterales bacterium]
MFSRGHYTVPLPDMAPLRLGGRTLVMGIVNVTPDSFSDGGQCLDPDRALEHALHMEADGADLLDIGGESTRPGAAAVSVEEELARVVPVLDQLMGRVRVPVSIDTYKAEVARVALDHGAVIVNDVSGLLYEPALAPVVAERGAALVLMHNRGRSRNMYREAEYDNVGVEVAGELGGRIDAAIDAGVDRSRIIIDPGLGFAKRAEHTYAALAALDRLTPLDRPMLVGPSRKSFLVEDAGSGVDDREWGTAAAVTAAVLGGAHIVRVHRVREMAQVVRVADRIRTNGTAVGGSREAGHGQ